MILVKDHGNQGLCSVLPLRLGLKAKNIHSFQVFMGEQLNVPLRSDSPARLQNRYLDDTELVAWLLTHVSQPCFLSCLFCVTQLFILLYQ